MNETQKMAVFFAALYLGLVFLMIPLILKKIKPNKIYGLRIKETLGDEEVWYSANTWSGRLGMNIAIFLGMVSLVSGFFVNLAVDQFAMVNLALMLVVLGIWAVMSISYAKGLSKQKQH